jgi:hypothetical protein
MENKIADYQIDFNSAGLGLDCDICFDSDTTIIIYPEDTRATELRLCDRHAKQLRDVLNDHYPVKARK